MTRKLLTPFQKFVQLESFSGILLAIATVIALIWANSSFYDSYAAFLNFEIGFSSDFFSLKKPLILWINDGFMAIFFFLIGLEIKREVLVGELNSTKKALFPFFGALGGMSVPVLLFFILNNNPETQSGWGIPMATDIAFSLAILKALGKRVPLALKVFLTAFAIVDDIGAVLVIAIFYSTSLQLDLLLYALLIIGSVTLFSLKVRYSKYINIFAGIIAWVLFLKAGIHPTLAGILMAFAVPMHRKIKGTGFIEQLKNLTDKIYSNSNPQAVLLTNDQIKNIDQLEDLTEKYQSPLQSLENRLHDWVAYFIIPVFALANAGVALSSDVPLEWTLIMNLSICLVLGNSIGISSIVLLAQKLKLVQIPHGITKRHIIGASFIAGVGFTMSIFIATLAFYETPQYVDSAKIGILIGSLVSGAIGATILYISGSKKDDQKAEVA
ncbi:Na+/H+ antiporter NhaA [Nonlabens dokdonensis]|uniref:Na(+)/H(+) antiporter NhaA n=1 Tax=Nonlabens dokdonensis TaxID=328515 RepID=A0A1Z8AM59_9FLAO|nr:Na+/H+ antiporter NhaA [Nonlabens dokdonensis]OUS11434.1 Na+/H+ antiporter NhaA [Nonlabens dokdonensis]